MWSKLLRRISGLLVVVAYAAATVVAAASPLAACPAFDDAHHGAHPPSVDHTSHRHDEGPKSHPGDRLKCCVGTCLLGVSLPPPSNGATSLAFYGTPTVYASEHSVLPDRSIPPDPGPPKPIA